MIVRWLGWAGVEIEAGGNALLIDPLLDAAAVFAALGPEAEAAELPIVVAPKHKGSAEGALLTHLHRDHADLVALEHALADEAPIFHPHEADGEGLENLSLVQADAELDRIDHPRRSMHPWESTALGPFAVTALPAVDGLGDPQLSWLVECEGAKVLHLGDTILHGYWWRMALRHGPFDVVLAPVNGAVLDFPHRQPSSPLPSTLDPEQAALAGELLGAKRVVPFHYGGFAIEPYYRPVADAAKRFGEAAKGRPYDVELLQPGEELIVDAQGAAS